MLRLCRFKRGNREDEYSGFRLCADGGCLTLLLMIYHGSWGFVFEVGVGLRRSGSWRGDFSGGGIALEVDICFGRMVWIWGVGRYL